jgi:maltokinase
VTAFHDMLSTYLASRRWFAGKGREFTIRHVHELPWLPDAEPRARVEVVTVQFDDGKQDSYQFPTAYLDRVDPEMGHALVGAFSHPELGDVVAYDAVYFKSITAAILAGFHRHLDAGHLRFRTVDGAEVPEQSVTGTVMTAEQSNTSVAFGEEAILKLYRRLSPGTNPDIEVHEALTRHGSDHVAPLIGWIEADWLDSDGRQQSGDLAMMQNFLRTGTDGWDIALSSVRDLLVEEDLYPDEVGGDFAGEAWRLGEATANVHSDLAVLFDTGTLTEQEQRGLGEAMSLRLEAAVGVVPEIEEFAPALRAHYVAVTELERPVAVQRIHGDLHLGQTLRTVKGWKILDFEGEPAKSLPERVALDSPLRDIAGMLRSFDYAAGATLRQFGAGDHLTYRAKEWSQRNREAFSEGYAAASGAELGNSRVLLQAYETDKAVYEAVYEARNRPSWLTIPLQAIARIAAEE